MASLLDLLRSRRTPRLLAISHDSGSGPVVILLPGIASSSVAFTALYPFLAEGHRVIAIDLLGFGKSPAPADSEYTLEEHVEAVSAAIASLKLKGPFTLVGHSLGCLISSRYAATHGKRVAKLVLVSPPIYLSPSEIGEPRMRSQVAGYLNAYQFLRANKRFTLANAAFVTRTLRLKDIMDITEKNWVPFVKTLERCIESQTVFTDLAAVRAPIEIAYGRLDEFIAPGSMDLVERLRGVTVHRVNVSDHVIRKPLARVVATAIDGSSARPSTRR